MRGFKQTKEEWFAKDNKKVGLFEQWFSSEILRLGKLFDMNGQFVADEKLIIPLIGL